MRPGKVLALQKNVKIGRFLQARSADRRQRLVTDGQGVKVLFR
jgi:hypothetical protein